MTKGLIKPVGLPRVEATCGQYRVVAVFDGFRLEKKSANGSERSEWNVLGTDMTTVELVVAYERETGLFSADLMALRHPIEEIERRKLNEP